MGTTAGADSRDTGCCMHRWRR